MKILIAITAILSIVTVILLFKLLALQTEAEEKISKKCTSIECIREMLDKKYGILDNDMAEKDKSLTEKIESYTGSSESKFEKVDKDISDAKYKSSS